MQEGDSLSKDSDYYSNRFRDFSNHKDFSQKLQKPVQIPNHQSNLINESNCDVNLPFKFTNQEILEVFNTLDIHKNNFLTKDELNLFLQILNIPATEEEVEEMINLADKQNNKKVHYEDFREMAQGKILSPIGIAYPPTLGLLENKNVQFDNLQNLQYEKITQQLNAEKQREILEKNVKKINDKFQLVEKEKERKRSGNFQDDNYQEKKILGFNNFFKLEQFDNVKFKQFYKKLKKGGNKKGLIANEQEFFEFFEVAPENKAEAEKCFNFITLSEPTLNLKEILINWISQQSFELPNKCFLSFYVMDSKEKGMISFEEAVKIISWMNFQKKSKRVEDHLRKIFKTLKLNTDIYINVALFEKITKNFSQNLFEEL